ncbi:MAG: rfaE bifunctional protein nucleotidyltransferase chain/domain, partial [Limisphaerales bacterium]
MSLKDKIVPSESLADWRQRLRAEGRRLVVTNGCFDLLHAGHVIYLETARGFGDALLIGLNSDESVRELKGEGRPLNTASDRAIVLAGLESVTAVTVFPDTLAARFLSVAQP